MAVLEATELELRTPGPSKLFSIASMLALSLPICVSASRKDNNTHDGHRVFKKVRRFKPPCLFRYSALKRSSLRLHRHVMLRWQKIVFPFLDCVVAVRRPLFNRISSSHDVTLIDASLLSLHFIYASMSYVT
jgi:hypothetical protein